MAEVLINDFHTALTAQLLASAGAGSAIAVSPGAPAAYVGSDTRLRVGQEVIVATVTTATSWTVVQRAAEDADRFPAATHPSGSAVAAVLTAGGLAAVVGGAGFARTNAENTFSQAQAFQGGFSVTSVVNGVAATWNTGGINVTGGITATAGVSANSLAAANGVSGKQGLFTIADPAEPGIVVRGATSQTANLTDWKNSSGTVVLAVKSDGNLTCQNGQLPIAIDSPTMDGTRHGTILQYRRSTGEAVTICEDNGTFSFRTHGWHQIYTDELYAGHLSASPAAAANGLRINANASQSANLIQCYTPASATLFLVGPTGGVYTTTSNPAAVPLSVRGAASQTANLTEWQDSGGTALAAVAKNGAFKPASLADADAENNTVYYSTDAGKLVYKDPGGTVNSLY